MATDKLTIAISGKSNSEVVEVRSVTIHPQYSLETLANNIAVIVFSISKNDNTEGSELLTSKTWDERYFFRRTLSDPTAPKWNNPLTSKVDDKGKDLCTVASPIYAANTADFICSSATAAPNDISTCKLPYGMGYGVKSKSTVPIAVYSHTVVFGDGLCSESKQVSYYTMLSNFLTWANNIASTQAKKLSLPAPNEESGSGSGSGSGNKDYQMKAPTNPVPVVKLYGGDLYKQLPTDDEGSDTDTSETDTELPGGPASSDDSLSDKGNDTATDCTDETCDTVDKPTEDCTEDPTGDSNTDGDTGYDPGSATGDPIIPAMPSYITITVQVTSYVTITTYSDGDGPTSSAPGCDDDNTASDGDDCNLDSNGSPGSGGNDDIVSNVKTLSPWIPGNTSDPGESSPGGVPTDSDSASDNNTDEGTGGDVDTDGMEDCGTEATGGDAPTDDSPSDTGSTSGNNTDDNATGGDAPTDDSPSDTGSTSGNNTDDNATGGDAPTDDSPSDTDNTTGNNTGDDATDSDTGSTSDNVPDGDTTPNDTDNTDNTESNTSDDNLSDNDSDRESETSPDSTGDSSPNTSGESSGGISRTTAILVGILVPVAIIIIVGCLYYYFKKK
ncbi:hypothetical protein H4R24_004121 [Coemansia sp. RSA 988]|nr:hypothetical protein H4R24_004121 [Coemansia sp. RSA 988]